MATSNFTKNALLKLVFNGTAIDNVADNASSVPATTLALSLHTASPGVGGSPSTNVATYTGYVGTTVARTALAMPVDENAHTASNAAVVSWPQCSGGASQVVTHVAASMGGQLWAFAALPASITVAAGDVPRAAIGALVFTMVDA